MIRFENNVFLLSNDRLSYMMRVGEYGELQHIHFGGITYFEDASELSVKPGLGWGINSNFDEKLSLQYWPLEWSGSGRGDYRETPLELGEGMPTFFRYKSHLIHKGNVPFECSLPGAHGAEETLEIILEDNKKIGLHLFYSLYDTAVVRRAVLVNNTDKDINIRKIASSQMDLNGKFDMITFNGAWSKEMHMETVPVGRTGVMIESTTGNSSAFHNPGFILKRKNTTETDGVCYGFNLVYSGNHYERAQLSSEGLTRVIQGISPNNFSWTLKPGEKFETPEAVLSWSDKGLNGLSHNFHHFVTENIVPPYWKDRERPILFNSWEGCTFNFTERKLLSLAKEAKELGCEMFVLDDGWFGERNNSRAGLGDYNVNLKKLPNGLKGLSEKIRKMDLKFGLWFEPEAVNPNSDLYRAHPEWALGYQDDMNVLGRHEYLLDLEKQEVQDYIVENVAGIIDDNEIDYVKWDMNRNSIALGAKAHRCILGVYSVMRRIFGPRPQVLLENCASGGNRFDLGMLCFAPQTWGSDDTDPIERLDIQRGYSYLYPLSTVGAHVSMAPHAQTLRQTPLSTRGNVAFFGLLGYELDLAELSQVDKFEIKEQIEFYKTYRKVFQFGEYSRLYCENGISMQVAYGDTVIAGLFHKLINAAPDYEFLYPTGLKRNAFYTIVSRAQLLRVGDYGSLLKNVIPVSVRPDGLIVRLANRMYKMKENTEKWEASGSAIVSGLPLAQLYAGMGYSEELRMEGDFLSNIYVISMKEENE